MLLRSREHAYSYTTVRTVVGWGYFSTLFRSTAGIFSSQGSLRKLEVGMLKMFRANFDDNKKKLVRKSSLHLMLGPSFFIVGLLMIGDSD